MYLLICGDSVIRGGYYNDTGYNPSGRSYGWKSDNAAYVSFRVQLYIK